MDVTPSQDPRLEPHLAWKNQWQQYLQQMAAQKQATWQAARQLTLGGSMPGWSPPTSGVDMPYANPLLSRFSVPGLAQADPGNALAGFFMGQQGVGDNPMLLHALLGGEPGLANV